MEPSLRHSSDAKTRKAGLVLAGGGARGAYQVGVLRGVHEISCSLGVKIPSAVITGVSAGAINAAYLAAYADDLEFALQRLEDFWGDLHSDDVFGVDLSTLSRIGAGWILDVATGGAGDTHSAQALLDTAPLAALVRAHIPFGRIAANLISGCLDGVAVSATDYESTENVTFFMSRDESIEPWQRAYRLGVRQVLESEHVLASAAIPLLFPPVTIQGRHYGDGCLRHAAPLSAALHLGAKSLLIIGVRRGAVASLSEYSGILTGSRTSRPSIARILSVIVNAVLLEAVEIDIERLDRINRTIAALSKESKAVTPLRSVDWLYIHPSEDIGAIAKDEMKSLPRSIRYLLRGLGPRNEAADLASYLLFEPPYCKRLMALGKRDALARQDEVADFLTRRDPGAEAPVDQPTRLKAFRKNASGEISAP